MTSKTKTSGPNGTAPDLSLEQIQQQFDALRASLSDFAVTLVALGATTVDATIAAGADRVAAASAVGRAKARQAEESIGRHIDEMVDVVRDRPFRAFAMSAALGLVFGYFVARRR